MILLIILIKMIVVYALIINKLKINYKKITFLKINKINNKVKIILIIILLSQIVNVDLLAKN